MLMHPSLPPAGPARDADPAHPINFFSVFFAMRVFLQKISLKNRKNRRSGIFGVLLRPKKNMKTNKNSKMGSPGPRFWVFFGPQFANLKTFKFAAMRSVS